MSSATNHRPRIVIIGGGFAGINAANQFRDQPVDVVIIDKQNHHVFQPLLYQVATAALSPAEIAAPIRKLYSKCRNIEVIMGEVVGIDVEARCVKLDDATVPYDYLIVAAGARTSYFGHDHWRAHAPGLKTIDDALRIRRRFLVQFEEAELEADDEAREADLTFVIVGGGPTGVELAGAIAEIALTTIPHDFRLIDTRTANIILIDSNDRVLRHFPDRCSQAATRQLEDLGVQLRLNERVTDVDENGVTLRSGERIEAGCVIWAAGVKASPLGAMLGAETDKGGRVKVNKDLSLPGHPEVFVAGDLAHTIDAAGNQVPGVAQGAIQMGKHAARTILNEARSGAKPGTGDRPAFVYKDKGSLATVGRNKAVARIWGREFAGRFAWLLWAVVHILFLVGFRNRVSVVFTWIWQYIFFERGARLITGEGKLKVRRSRYSN